MIPRLFLLYDIVVLSLIEVTKVKKIKIIMWQMGYWCIWVHWSSFARFHLKNKIFYLGLSNIRWKH